MSIVTVKQKQRWLLAGNGKRTAVYRTGLTFLCSIQLSSCLPLWTLWLITTWGCSSSQLRSLSLDHTNKQKTEPVCLLMMLVHSSDLFSIKNKDVFMSFCCHDFKRSAKIGWNSKAFWENLSWKKLHGRVNPLILVSLLNHAALQEDCRVHAGHQSITGHIDTYGRFRVITALKRSPVSKYETKAMTHSFILAGTKTMTFSKNAFG